MYCADKIEKFLSYFGASERVAIISHTNPDGDAIGSGLAMLKALRKLDSSKSVRFFTPNDMSTSLRYIDSARDTEVFMQSTNEYRAYIAASDLIIIVDLNDTNRLEVMSESLECNITAPRILIDHHVAPPKYDLSFHSTDVAATAVLVYGLIKAIGVEIDSDIAVPLYAAMMTDTGCFSFGHLTPELYRAVAELVESGINPQQINYNLLNQQSEDRIRMTGYLIEEKMTVIKEHSAAYVTLTMEEKTRFNHQIGDTEGVVNIPLTIKGVDFSALLIENRDHIKLSLRSVGSGVDVNKICREHFNGGGHTNAAGGKFFGTLEEATTKINQIIEQL